MKSVNSGILESTVLNFLNLDIVNVNDRDILMPRSSKILMLDFLIHYLQEKFESFWIEVIAEGDSFGIFIYNQNR